MDENRRKQTETKRNRLKRQKRTVMDSNEWKLTERDRKRKKKKTETDRN